MDIFKLTSSVRIQAEVETQRGSITVQFRSQPHTPEAHDPAALDLTNWNALHAGTAHSLRHGGSHGRADKRVFMVHGEGHGTS